MVDQKVDYKDFIEDLENALGMLSQGSNLSVLEKLIDNFIISSQGKENTVAFINFQIQLFENFEVHGNPLFLYMKSDLHVDYNGKYKQAFRRLENLRKVSGRYLSNAERSISLPNELSTTFFLYSDKHPNDLKMTLVNNDQSSFSTDIDFNGALNLVHDLINNLNDKLNKGNNSINPQIVDNYRDISNQFLGNVYRVISEKSNEIN